MIVARLFLFSLVVVVSAAHASSNVRSGDEDVLDQRQQAEKASQTNSFIITQHRSNYLLLHSTMSNPNQVPYEFLGQGNALDRQEAKYQLSIKAPLYIRHQGELEGFYLGYTIKSWWQVFNGAISKPFRETNYEPEGFYQWMPEKQFGELELMSLRLGINHQSNGRSTQLSRSWNRVFASALVQHRKMFARLKVWWRDPESKKDYPADPKGDDNPDIEHYMGNFELTLGTKIKRVGVTALFRNNLNAGNNKRYTEVNLTYPFWGDSERFDWVIQYVNGYGESLIDYDHKLRRIGIGVQLRSF